MFKNVLLSFGGFLFSSLLFIIYFIKAKKTGINNKIFKTMLFFLILAIVSEIAAVTVIYYIRDNKYLVDFICRIHQLCAMIWMLSTALYSITIGRGYKIENMFTFLFYEERAKPVLIASIFFLTAIPFTKFNNIIDGDGAYMSGSAEFIHYFAGAFVIYLFIKTLRENKEELPEVNMTPVKLGVIAAIVQVIAQLFFPVILITTECFVFTTYLFYFSFENPDLYLIKELEKSKQKADESNKTKTEFLSNMSHEIRTPINAIIGFSEGILNDQEIEKKEAIEDVYHIQAAGNNLLEIINNILDISKIENGEEYLEEKEYDIGSLLTELKTIMDGRLIDKKIRFITNIDNNIPSKLYGDKTKIFQIFLNILSNASKYTEVGRITLTLNSEMVEEKVMLHIKISDTGFGIKKDDFDKLFEKFSRLDNTTKKEIEGTGLGLLITKNLVNIMGGKIWFESEYGAGTTFYVDIPQVVVDSTPIGELQLTTKQEEEEKQLDCTGFNLLLVDDNKLNLLVAEKVLKPYNFNIEKVMKGEDCINLIKEGKKYDLIFMDIMMPEMSGEEVLAVLKKLDGYIIPPVVALTANAIAGAKEKYLGEGFNDYLSKPIDIKELDLVINKYFRGKPKRQPEEDNQEQQEVKQDTTPEQTTIEPTQEVKQEESKAEQSTEEVHSNEVKDVIPTESAEETKENNEETAKEVPTEQNVEEPKEEYNEEYLKNNGINLEDALNNLQDLATFKEVLGFLYDDIDKQLANIEASQNDSMKYATLAHGLKSDCRSLGINELADKCLEHEQKGKDNDLEFIKNDYPNLKEMILKYKELIKKYLKR